ncbi:MAG: radical SAM family heme chaperone HemW [Terriglobales bacterium]
MAVGIYISVPFCRTKCSYCNFASGVFSRLVFAKYVERLCADISRARETAGEMGGEFDPIADSIYLGGGTPTVLEAGELKRIFAVVRQTFTVAPEAEITVECAPGTLKNDTLDVLLGCGVNRVSLGVQSFVDEEARAVGRLHTRAAAIEDIRRLHEAGIENLSVDLIAGLPHQTAESWRQSLEYLLGLGVPHASVYMLEVDEESRLGRELIAGGTRYHAHFVPDEDVAADFYLAACKRLDAAGLRQYEISNFAGEGRESRHNLKYWTRQPYLGFGVDAHSMLHAASDAYALLRAQSGADRKVRESGTGEAGGMRPCSVSAADLEAVRFATPDSLENYLAGAALTRTPVSVQSAREEEFFLGLRMTRGINLGRIALRYGIEDKIRETLEELKAAELLEQNGEVVRLTARGRLLSNEVFERFV